MSKKSWCVAALVVVVSLARAQVDRVAYSVEYREDVLDRAFVTATLSGKAGGAVDLQIPAWSPGAYEIKPFFKRIVDVAAKDAKGEALHVERIDDLSWRVAASPSWPVVVSYGRLDQAQGLSDGGGPSPRARNYVGFLPTDTFLYVVGRKEVPHEVRFRLPQGWLAQMALPKGENAFHFLAPDYDTIVDAPVELGHLTVHRFDVGGVTYSIVLDFRDKKFPLLSLEAMLRRIVRHQVGMWSATAPYAEYQFQFHDGPGFGLEHLSSTTIAVPGFLLRGQGAGIFDSLCAHEFFHAWNVKRLRPRQLGPFDYTKPVRSKALWFSEGVTDYYADMTCWRTGLWNDGKFLGTLREEIQRLQSTPRRLVESVEEASWRAFDRGYAAFGTEEHVDYYNKGKLIGLCADLLIREKSGGERSLDDVMRGLYEKYALPNAGFEDDALAQEFSNLAGFDMRPFFARYVSGVEELPFVEALDTIGLKLTPGAPDRNGALGWWKRSELSIENGELFVKRPARTLREMGLKSGDFVLAVNDQALPAAREPKALYAALVPEGAGATILRVRRDQKIMAVLISIPTARNWDLEQIANPTPAQRARFEVYRADRYSALVKDGPTLDTIGVPSPKR